MTCYDSMRVFALALATATACGRTPQGNKAPETAQKTPIVAETVADAGQEAERSLQIERVALEHAGAIGVSGLTEGPNGLLAVTERNWQLLDIRDGRLAAMLPIEGVADGVELEAVSWDIDHPEEVLFGTETQDAGKNPLLVGRLESGRVVVTGAIESEDLVGGPNSGFEGICRVGDTIVAALEDGELRGGRRHGTLVVLRGDDTRKVDVQLTTGDGRLAAIDCEDGADGLSVYAIERHFGVARIVHIAVTKGQSEGEATLVADLLPFLNEKENFEGIEREGDGVFVLVNDNDFGEVFGPSSLVRVRLPSSNR